MVCSVARTQRAVVEECLKWTTQRKVFGKPLHSQAVIRNKLAAMISRVESVQNWLECITYQMNQMVRDFRLPWMAVRLISVAELQGTSK